MRRVRYNSGDEVIEIKVLDSMGGKLDVRRSNKCDSKGNWKWLKWLIDKWGVKFKKSDGYVDPESEFLKY